MNDYKNLDYLTRQQGCDLLQISDDALDRLIRRGDITAYKVGGAVRIDRLSIGEYLLKRMMGPKA